MEKRKKLKRLKVSIVVFLIVIAISISVFGRYIYNSVKESYLSAKQFYFTSDILTINGAKYEYDNWSGIDVYPIDIELYSYNNKLAKLDYDLNYKLTCESLSTDKIACSIGSSDGPTSVDNTIYVSQNNTSKVTIFVKPTGTINNGEKIKLKVTASTEEPYKKQLSCEITLNIKSQSTYSIEDIANRDYALLKLVNENEGQTSVNLRFDPNKLRLDLNDEIYQEMTIINTITIDGKNYVNEVQFNLPKETAKNIKFYKVDKSQDYTYPKGSATSAITVNI